MSACVTAEPGFPDEGDTGSRLLYGGGPNVKVSDEFH